MSLHGRSISGAPVSRTVGGPLTLLSRSDDRPRGAGTFVEPLVADGASPYVDRIAIRSRSRIIFLETREVAWLEAYGNYVRFHVMGGENGEPVVHTVRGTLSSFERRLDPSRFVRIHRSVIVNVDVVRELHSRRTGDFTLVTRAGDELTLSRNFRNRVAELRRLLAS
jgi:two-component system LytT family response regulator